MPSGIALRLPSRSQQVRRRGFHNFPSALSPRRRGASARMATELPFIGP